MKKEKKEISRHEEKVANDDPTCSRTQKTLMECPILTNHSPPRPSNTAGKSEDDRKQPMSESVYLREKSIMDIILEYEKACFLYNIEPSHDVISQIAEANGLHMELKNLDLSHLKLNSQTIKTLHIILNGFNTIYKLSIRGIELDEWACDALFQMFAHTDRIVQLKAGEISLVGDFGLRCIYDYFIKAKKLKILDLDGTFFIERFVKEISLLAFNVSRIKVIRLNNCHLQDKHLRSLYFALRINRHLKGLFLSNNHITSNSCVYIARIVKNCSALRLIDLSNNCLKDSGLISLIDELMISELFWIRKLYLRNTGITVAGMKKMIDYLNGGGYLRYKNSIQILDLSYNNIGDEGIEMLKPILIENKSLYELNLSSTNLSSKGLKAVVEIIALNRRLHIVDIRNNPTGKSGFQAISQVLKNTFKSMKVYTNANFKLEVATEKDANLILHDEKEECLENIKNPYYVRNPEYDDEMLAGFGDLTSHREYQTSYIDNILQVILIYSSYVFSKIAKIVYTSIPNPNTENILITSNSNLDVIKKNEIKSENNDPSDYPVKFEKASTPNSYKIEQSLVNLTSENTKKPTYKGHRHCQSETIIITPFIRKIIEDKRHKRKMSMLSSMYTFKPIDSIEKSNNRNPDGFIHNSTHPDQTQPLS